MSTHGDPLGEPERYDSRPSPSRLDDPHRPLNDSEAGLRTPGVARPGGSYHKHGHVVFMAIVYTFWALLSFALVALAIFKIVTEDSGYVVMLGVFGFIGLLTGYQARHYLSDLNKEPVMVEGEVLRKWHKGNLLIFFFPSFYIYVEGNIYSIRAEDYKLILESDLVRIWHYPNSLTVDYLERYDSVEKRFVATTYGVSL